MYAFRRIRRTITLRRCVIVRRKSSKTRAFSPAFFKILKEQALVQKSTIPHMKALLFSYLEPEG